MKNGVIEYRPIQRRNVESGYSMVTVTFDYPEEGLIVGERIAQEITKLVPEVIEVSDMDYIFFEGYRSKDGQPGFAIYGKERDDPERMKYLVRVGYRSADMADTICLPERFFTGRAPKPNFQRYCIEVPNVSPLCSSLVPLEFKGLEELLENLKISSQDLGLGIEFYDRFEGEFIPQSEFPASLKEQLEDVAEFGGQKGRYLVMVVSDNEGGPEYNYGHFRGISELNSIFLTDKHRLGGQVDERLPMFSHENPLYFGLDKVRAIFGKGMSLLYDSMKQQEEPK